MKISIKHINNTFNYGSAMMAITLIRKISDNISNVEFYVDANSDVNLERLKKETGFRDIYRDNVGYGNSILEKCIKKIKQAKLNLKVNNINIVIVIGGDDISEYYGISTLNQELNRLKKESIRKNIILLGQTVGPFTRNREEIARKCLEKTIIYTRDDKNLKYLNKIKFANAKKGRDLAFMKLPMQDKSKYILDKYKLEKDKYITIVSSGLNESYTKNTNSYIKEQVNIIQNIMNNDKLKNKKIVLLPHVLLPEHVDDRLIIRDIMKNIDNKFKNRIIDIYDEMLPSEARRILGSGVFTITGRMHAAVSTFYMRKPAISLSYSIKYSGVIGDGLDMNELVIESADDKIWTNGEISKLVDEKVNYVLENYDELIRKIDVKVSETSKIVEEELNDVIREIKKYIE